MHLNNIQLIHDIPLPSLQFDQAVGALPNPDWPVSQQLEHAVSTIKKNVKLVMDAKAEAAVFKKVYGTVYCLQLVTPLHTHG